MKKYMRVKLNISIINNLKFIERFQTKSSENNYSYNNLSTKNGKQYNRCNDLE